MKDILDKIIGKAKTQKEVAVANQGIENVFTDIGQKEKEIDIEFGRQSVEGVTENFKNAQKGIEHILENDIIREDELRALDIKNNTVFQREEVRKEQGGVIVHNSQPDDIKIENNAESVTTPKADNEKVEGTIEEFANAFGMEKVTNLLGQKSIKNEQGQAIPLKPLFSDARKITIEQFEKIIGKTLITDSPVGTDVIEQGESALSI